MKVIKVIAILTIALCCFPSYLMALGGCGTPDQVQVFKTEYRGTTYYKLVETVIYFVPGTNLDSIKYVISERTAGYYTDLQMINLRIENAKEEVRKSGYEAKKIADEKKLWEEVNIK